METKEKEKILLEMLTGKRYYNGECPIITPYNNRISTCPFRLSNDLARLGYLTESDFDVNSLSRAFCRPVYEIGPRGEAFLEEIKAKSKKLGAPNLWKKTEEEKLREIEFKDLDFSEAL